MPETLTEEDLQPPGAKLSEDDLQPEPAGSAQAATDLAEQRSNVLQFQADNSGHAPARSAEVLRLSAVTGQSPELVDANFDALKKRAEADQGVDWAAVSKQAPKLAATLAADPHLQAAATPDVHHLKLIEWAGQTLGEFQELAKGMAPRPGIGSVLGPLGVLFSPNYEVAKKEYIGPAFSAAQRELVKVPETMLGYLNAPASLVREAATGQLGKESPTADPYGRLFLKSFGADAAGLGIDYTARMVVSAFYGEHAYDSMNPAERRMAVEGLREKWGEGGSEALHFFATLLPMMATGGLGAAEKLGGAAKVFSEAKGLGAVTTKLLGLAARTAGSVTENAGFGLAQSSVTPGLAPEEGMKSAAKFGLLLHGAFEGGGFLLRGLPASIENPEAYWSGKDATRQASSAISNAAVAIQLDAAGATKLRETSPAALEHVLQNVAPEGWVSYPAKRWAEHFQGLGIDPLQEAARVTEDGGKGFADAASVNGYFRVPIQKLLKNLAGTGHDAELLEDMRVGDGFSPREIQDLVKQRGQEAKADLEQRAGVLYLDPVTGLRTSRAARETPVGDGNVLGTLTLPAVKGINDHPTAGGHDVANALLRQVAGVVGEGHPEAAREGTNFTFEVPKEGAESEVKAIAAKVKAALPEGVDVVSAAGEDHDAAHLALREETERRRALPPEAEEHVPARGALKSAVDVPGLKFEGKGAKGEVPKELVERVKGLTPEQFEREAYQDKVTVGGKEYPTGLGTRQAFYRMPAKAYTMSLDLKGLGKMDRESGDRLLHLFSTTASAEGGALIRLSHLSGDEFAATHADPDVLHGFAEYLRDALKGVTVEGTSPATGKPEQFSVDFRHGVGTDYGEADRDLNQRRLAANAPDQGRGLPGAADREQGLPGRGLEVPNPARRQALLDAWRRAVSGGPEQVARDALARARSVAGPGELPEVTAGLSKEGQEAYQRTIASANQQAAKTVKEKLAERAKAIDADRAAFRDQVEAQVDRQPVYQAWRYLEDGTLPPEFVKSIGKDGLNVFFGNGQLKLNRAEFVQAFGEDVAARMPPNAFELKGRSAEAPSPFERQGISADELAPLFGYGSGDELVQELTQATPRGEAIAGGVQQAIDAKYGSDLEASTNAAMSALHNEPALRAALAEHRALVAQLDPAAAERTRTLSPQALHAQAERHVGELLVDQVDPEAFADNERRAFGETKRLLGAGDKAGAAAASEQRLLEKALYMAARDAKEELDAARARMVNPSDKVRAQLGKADPAYRDVHDAILAAAQLGEAPAPSDVPPKSLDQMLAVAEAAGRPMAFDVDGIRKLLAQPKDFDSSMTVDEARNVADAIANIRTKARLQLEAKVLGEKVDRDVLKKELIDAVSKRPKLPELGEETASERALTKARLYGQAFDAWLTDPRTFVAELDAGVENGPWNKLLRESRLAARDKAVELTQKFQASVNEVWDKVPKAVRKLMDKPVDLSELPPLKGTTDNRTMATLARIYLQWGEEGNRQRLLDGRGWDRAAVERALQQIPDPLADALQRMLDSINGLFPEMADVHEREEGLRPEKLQAAPITIRGKERAGGYFPAKYDYRGSSLGGKQLAAQVGSVGQVYPDTYQRPAIYASFAKSRAEAVSQPLSLAWGDTLAHVSQVIHDTAYREWVNDVGGLLVDPEVRQALQEHLGTEREKQFLPWLQSIAGQRADSVPAHLGLIQRATGGISGAYARQAVGWSLRSAAGVMTDSLQAVATGEVSGAQLAKSLIKTWNPFTFRELHENGLKLSSEMRFRDAQNDNNLVEQLKDFGKPRGIFSKLGDTAYVFHSFVDRRTATAVFDAKLNQSLAEGLPFDEAVRRANDVVGKVLPSVDIGDKPAILRDKRGLGALLFFHGYANKVWNMNRRAFDGMYLSLMAEDSTLLDKSKAVARFAGTLLGTSVVHGLIGSFLSGRGPDKDESAAAWAARKTLLAPFHTLPFVGELGDALWQGKRPELRLPPQLAFTQGVFDRLYKLTHQAEKTGDESLLWPAVELLGTMATKGYNNQLHTTLDYLEKLDSGEAQPRGLGDVFGGLVYGQSKNQPANPLTAAQGLAE